MRACARPLGAAGGDNSRCAVVTSFGQPSFYRSGRSVLKVPVSSTAAQRVYSSIQDRLTSRIKDQTPTDRIFASIPCVAGCGCLVRACAVPTGRRTDRLAQRDRKSTRRHLPCSDVRGSVEFSDGPASTSSCASGLIISPSQSNPRSTCGHSSRGTSRSGPRRSHRSR